jgi:hypothetical protein
MEIEPEVATVLSGLHVAAYVLDGSGRVERETVAGPADSSE